jgi:negative regulator of sigma E activity
MANPSHEQLSALADDELEHDEAQLLLRRYADDADLRFRWVAYHVIGETVRRGRASARACDIVDRVGAALDDSNAASGQIPRRRNRHRYGIAILKPAGAAAVAAAVAVVAVLLVRQPPAEDLSASAPVTVVPPQTRAPRVRFNYAAVSAVRWNEGSAEVRRDLNEYLLDHNQNVPALSRQGMLPYVHMASLIRTGPKRSVPAGRQRQQDGGR